MSTDTQDQVSSGAALGISGVLEFKDKDGNILGTSEIKGRIPLSELGVTAEEAQQVIDHKESLNG